MIRKPSVEGRFYPDTRNAIFQLLHEIEGRTSYADPPGIQGTPIGAILPHAGHAYSGYQTIPFFRYLIREREVPDTFIIVNPNHRGTGDDVTLDPHKAWMNAAGSLSLDQELAHELPFPFDPGAQENEHAAEVIIPFIQYFFRDVPPKILPVCMNNQDSNTAIMLGKSLHQAVVKIGRRVLIIASSDFSHFLSPDEGYKQDQYVLDKILMKDTRGVEEQVLKHKVTVCGYGPIMTLMAYAALENEDYQAILLARGHSGEVHPSAEVVDYVSVMFHTSG
ncbi:MAG: AmmeMemoRadiSam system protein B [Bacteroidales bacterium]